MQIEHVTRIGFTARRTTQQQGNLTVGPGLLGQIIIDNQGILSAVTEILAHGTAGVGGNVLHSRGIRSRSSHHDGVLQCAVLFELAHHAGDGGLLLADSHVHTFNA